MAPINHTGPWSVSYYSLPIPLRVGGWVDPSIQYVRNLLTVAFKWPAVRFEPEHESYEPDALTTGPLNVATERNQVPLLVNHTLYVYVRQVLGRVRRNSFNQSKLVKHINWLSDVFKELGADKNCTIIDVPLWSLFTKVETPEVQVRC